MNGQTDVNSKMDFLGCNCNKALAWSISKGLWTTFSSLQSRYTWLVIAYCVKRLKAGTLRLAALSLHPGARSNDMLAMLDLFNPSVPTSPTMKL
jgi:hypothetical protein